MSQTISALTRVDRLALLAVVNSTRCPSDLVDALIDNDLTVFSQWLKWHRGTRLELYPLPYERTARWLAFVRQAVECGVPVTRLREDVIPNGYSTAPTDAAATRDFFAAMADDADTRIAELGRFGLDWASARLREAQEEERRALVYGVEEARSR